MTKTAKIYDSMIYSDNIEYFETTRHKELDQIFQGCVASVKKTVEPELAKAIEAIRDIAIDLECSAHKCGMAQGIELAMNLHEILAHPYEIMEESDNYAISISSAEAAEIEVIGKYLKNIDRKDETL